MSTQRPESREVAERLFEWLSSQTYQGENILHAIVCCDFASGQHFKAALEKQIALALDNAWKGGMERAAEIADNLDAEQVDFTDGNWRSVTDSIAAAIRAAKERG